MAIHNTKPGIVELAEMIATSAHAGQFRRDGVTPYINHPRSVAERLHEDNSPEVIAAAWLHDVLEDTKTTILGLRNEGIPDRVIDSVVTLTRRDESYSEYLRNVKADPIARKVKIADILHNLSDKPTDKQIRKYALALMKLMD